MKIWSAFNDSFYAVMKGLLGTFIIAIDTSVFQTPLGFWHQPEKNFA